MHLQAFFLVDWIFFLNPVIVYYLLLVCKCSWLLYCMLLCSLKVFHGLCLMTLCDSWFKITWLEYVSFFIRYAMFLKPSWSQQRKWWLNFKGLRWCFLLGLCALIFIALLLVCTSNSDAYVQVLKENYDEKWWVFLRSW